MSKQVVLVLLHSLLQTFHCNQLRRGISESGNDWPIWENWSNDDTEQEVAKLMEEDVEAAMQFLQSKAPCIMPISLAALIYPTNQPDIISTLVKPESPVPLQTANTLHVPPITPRKP